MFPELKQDENLNEPVIVMPADRFNNRLVLTVSEAHDWCERNPNHRHCEAVLDILDGIR